MSLSINKNLKNKVVAITGAGGVLCGQFSKECARQGMKVALLDLNLKSVEELSIKLNKEGFTTIGVECNVLEMESIQKACDVVIEKFGKVDILINGAGGNSPKAITTNEYFNEKDINDPSINSFFDMKTEGFNFVFNLNFLGTFNPIQIFAKHMLKDGCSIINISSASSPHSLTKVPAYSAAKAAINNFTQWVATHFANTGLRCNSIAPGFFLTTQNHDLLIDKKTGKYTDRTKKILAGTPMNKLGVPEDLLGTLIYLMDENMSGFVTGTVMFVDGGFCSYLGV